MISLLGKRALHRTWHCIYKDCHSTMYIATPFSENKHGDSVCLKEQSIRKVFCR